MTLETLKSGLRELPGYLPVATMWHRFVTSGRSGGYRLFGSPDGLPLPPGKLIHLVAGTYDASWYLHSGAVGHTSLRRILQKNGVDLDALTSVLDFGCGCGRMVRRFRPISSRRVFGTDYNPILIDWCAQNLSHLGEFSTNSLAPPLRYPDSHFDLVYTVSIFTHLTLDLQKAWMSELRRVLKPGGLLYMTVHGESRYYTLDDEHKKLFDRGEMFVLNEELVGKNICAAYHPETFVRKTLASGFDVVDRVFHGAGDAEQDVYLLRKS